MINSLVHILKHYLGLLILFALGKLGFMLWNLPDRYFGEIGAFLWHGIPLDLSMASYLILPALLIQSVERWNSFRFIRNYWLVIGSLIAFLQAADILYYHYWGMKLNLFFTDYLDDLGAGAGSVDAFDYVFVAFAFVAMWMWVWWLVGQHRDYSHRSLLYLLPLILLLGRGWHRVPIQLSSAMYHEDMQVNMAAINVPWNFAYMSIEHGRSQAYAGLDAHIEEELYSNWAEKADPVMAPILLNDSSRVILLAVESLGANMSRYFGGRLSYTPVLDKLAKESVVYSQAYAHSFRSDKGLTAMLTGLPSLSTQSWLGRPEVLARQPNLIDEFSQRGWHTSFHYGGHVADFNLGNLFLAADVVVDHQDLSGPSNAWGYHDEVVVNAMAEHVLTSPRPALHVYFSSSSHEPFDVPEFSRHVAAYPNSIAYADSCIGLLIDRLKARGEWDNTLIVVTADHGSSYPERLPMYTANNFHIPLVISGGLVRRSKVIDKVVSQLDIPTTLMESLGEESPFPYSHGLYHPKGVAFYHYFNGMVMVTDSCSQHYDIPLEKYLEPQCAPPLEQAVFQRSGREILHP